MHLRTPRPALLALLAALVVLAVACGGQAEADYDDADVAFLTGMVPHHEDAVEMAELVPDRTDRPELNQLADEIIETQQEEIEQMNAMLAEADAPPPGEGMEGMDDMAGMDAMSGEQMSSLEEATGTEFDVMFVDMMIAHHQGAIDAANEVLEEGAHPEIAELAEEIVAAQQAEIDDMTSWRQEWTATDG